MRAKTTTYKKQNQKIKVSIKAFKTGYKYSIQEHRLYKKHYNSITVALIINRIQQRGFKEV